MDKIVGTVTYIKRYIPTANPVSRESVTQLQSYLEDIMTCMALGKADRFQSTKKLSYTPDVPDRARVGPSSTLKTLTSASRSAKANLELERSD